jgi:hypothetical protein
MMLSHFGPSCSSKAYKRKESTTNKQVVCAVGDTLTVFPPSFSFSFAVFQVVKLFAMSLVHWFSPFFFL